MTLLLVALAEYAKEHSDEELRFSYSRLINKGYLIDEEMRGDDRYKLLREQFGYDNAEQSYSLAKNDPLY